LPGPAVLRMGQKHEDEGDAEHAGQRPWTAEP